MDFSVEINKCITVLQSGGVILYPTDTVWGIGCDATNETAVDRIYKIKNRNESKSMIALLDDESKLIKYMKQIPAHAFELIEYSQKPLTIIYPSAVNVARNLLAADGSLAIRITKDEFCKQLIYRFRKPIVSTSANISGNDTPQNFNDISTEIKSKVDYVVNLRQQQKTTSQPSSIISLGVNGEVKIIR